MPCQIWLLDYKKQNKSILKLKLSSRVYMSVRTKWQRYMKWFVYGQSTVYLRLNQLSSILVYMGVRTKRQHKKKRTALTYWSRRTKVEPSKGTVEVPEKTQRGNTVKKMLMGRFQLTIIQREIIRARTMPCQIWSLDLKKKYSKVKVVVMSLHECAHKITTLHKMIWVWSEHSLILIKATYSKASSFRRY